MNILISNDDGIHAPGIKALYDAMQPLGKVTLVAPASEQSAVGHAITLSDPLKTQRVYRNDTFFGFAVSGTPADCVKLGVTVLMDERPDLVISGINHGPNPGICVIYSGTVSAATEGTILGIPSMAISIDTFGPAEWETAAHVAQVLAPQLHEQGLPEDTLLNVNVPNIPKTELKGYRVTRMGRSRFEEVFHERKDPRGNVYYWMDGDMQLLDDTPDADIIALRDRYVSLTPIGIDLTQHSALQTLKEWPVVQDQT